MNLSNRITVQRGAADTLTAQLVKQLEEMIVCGEFSADARLPSAMQLARQVKVSYCTVEAVLKQLVAKELIERNPRGSFVKKRYTKMQAKNIAVVFHTRNERERLYKRKIVEGIKDILSPPAFTLKIMTGDEFREQGREWWTEVGCNAKYDGIILDKEGTLDADTMKFIKTAKPPFLLFNSGIHSFFDGVLRILPDFSRAFTQLAQHICELGHQRIALITRAKESSPDGMFRDAWQRTLSAYDIKPAPDYHMENVTTEPVKIRDAVLRLLQLPSPPDAIMCGDDIIAYHVINTLKDNGIKIPEDISVTGFNGFDIAEIMEPKLTTVKINLFSMGQLIGKKMLAMLRGERENGIINIEYQLIIGDSTGQRRQ